MTVRIEVRSNHPAAGQSVIRGAANLGVAGVTALPGRPALLSRT
jgi:hypothetical protein